MPMDIQQLLQMLQQQQGGQQQQMGANSGMPSRYNPQPQQPQPAGGGFGQGQPQQTGGAGGFGTGGGNPGDANSIYNSPRQVIDWAWGKYGSPGLTNRPPIVNQINAQIEKEMGQSGFGVGGQIGPELARRLQEYVSGGRNNVNAGQVGTIAAPMERTQMVPDISAASPWMTEQMAQHGASQDQILQAMQRQLEPRQEPNQASQLGQLLRAIMQGGQ